MAIEIFLKYSTLNCQNFRKTAKESRERRGEEEGVAVVGDKEETVPLGRRGEQGGHGEVAGAGRGKGPWGDTWPAGMATDWAKTSQMVCLIHFSIAVVIYLKIVFKKIVNSIKFFLIDSWPFDLSEFKGISNCYHLIME